MTVLHSHLDRLNIAIAFLESLVQAEAVFEFAHDQGVLLARTRALGLVEQTNNWVHHHVRRLEESSLPHRSREAQRQIDSVPERMDFLNAQWIAAELPSTDLGAARRSLRGAISASTNEFAYWAIEPTFVWVPEKRIVEVVGALSEIAFPPLRRRLLGSLQKGLSALFSERADMVEFDIHKLHLGEYMGRIEPDGFRPAWTALKRARLEVRASDGPTAGHGPVAVADLVSVDDLIWAALPRLTDGIVLHCTPDDLIDLYRQVVSGVPALPAQLHLAHQGLEHISPIPFDAVLDEILSTLNPRRAVKFFCTMMDAYPHKEGVRERVDELLWVLADHTDGESPCEWLDAGDALREHFNLSEELHE